LPTALSEKSTAENLQTPHNASAEMSSSSPKHSARQSPVFVNSTAQKKGKSIEEPTPTPKAYTFRSGLCNNHFVQDFRNMIVIAGCGADFQWLTENGFDFKEMSIVVKMGGY
jgi:hypothetical protein